MTDDNPALESDEEFEGVGAHRDNPRYDQVDEEEPEELVRVSDVVEAVEALEVVDSPDE